MPLNHLATSSLSAAGASATASGFELAPIVIGLLGGLALFLYGMQQMADALKTVAGDRLRFLLARLTTNRFMGVLTGAFVTAVIQSSSVTTVLVVGFVTAGIMTLGQSIGVIMGANIGTTATVQIIAFDVKRYALLIVFVGFAVMSLAKRKRLRKYGAGMLGLGLIFFGMGIMGDAMAPLRGYGPFLELMQQLEHPAVGILVGALFTALIQASAATTGIVIVLASQGLITLPAGIALALGANVGTCVTALLAAIGKPREAIRAAVVHVVFNVAGVVLWVGFIEHLARFVMWITPVAEGLSGAARLAAETPRQIANAHTVFNVANTAIFIGLTTQLGRLVRRLVPDLPERDVAAGRPLYLDDELLRAPALALDRARLEIVHMGEWVKAMMREILPAVVDGTHEALDDVAARDDAVDRLHGALVTYLSRIGQIDLIEDQTRELVKLMATANDLENIGDIIETNLVTLGRQRIEDEVEVSRATRGVLEEFHVAVSRALDGALLAVTEKDEQAARRVVAMKGQINRLADAARQHQARRLVTTEPRRLPAYTVEMDTLENLKRVFYFCKRIARGVIDPAQPVSPP